MKKLVFLVSVVALMSLWAQTSGTADTNQQRPNFLFVIADDQRYDQLGVVQREQGDKARFPWFQTPNMDRLAEDGVRDIFAGDDPLACSGDSHGSQDGRAFAQYE